MKRRNLLAFGAAAVGLASAPRNAVARDGGTFPVSVNGSPFGINQATRPVPYHDSQISIIELDSGTLHLDENDRLIGKINAKVFQYNKVNLDVAFAIFDGHSSLLGVARHTEVVQKIYLSTIMGTTDTWTIDFGTSRSFRQTASMAVAFSDVDVAKPFEEKQRTE